MFDLFIVRKPVSESVTPMKSRVATEQLFSRCRFSGEECNRTTDFTQFFDSYYYNCFTYRAPAGHVDDDDDDADSNLAEGLENGWSTVVLTGSSMLDQNVEEIRMIPGMIRSTIPDLRFLLFNIKCKLRKFVLKLK